jgi:hypothetical protein
VEEEDEEEPEAGVAGVLLLPGTETPEHAVSHRSTGNAMIGAARRSQNTRSARTCRTGAGGRQDIDPPLDKSFEEDTQAGAPFYGTLSSGSES